MVFAYRTLVFASPGLSIATCFAACLALRAAHLALNLATRHWTYFRNQKAWFLMGHPCITFIIIFRKINQ